MAIALENSLSASICMYVFIKRSDWEPQYSNSCVKWIHEIDENHNWSFFLPPHLAFLGFLSVLSKKFKKISLLIF